MKILNIKWVCRETVFLEKRFFFPLIGSNSIIIVNFVFLFVTSVHQPLCHVSVIPKHGNFSWAGDENNEILLIVLKSCFRYSSTLLLFLSEALKFDWLCRKHSAFLPRSQKIKWFFFVVLDDLRFSLRNCGGIQLFYVVSRWHNGWLLINNK